MSAEGVTRLSTIGEALRSAREAQGRSLHDASEATRIRSSYLEALEEERFGELGGSVYAKGFLRSYAGYLGVDPAPLLEAYRAQETPEAPVFERPPRAAGGLGSGRRGPGWLAVAIVCVTIILLVSLWGLLRPAPDPAGAQPAFVTTPVRTTGAGASWTRVTADGRLTVNGKDLGVAEPTGSSWRHTFTPQSRSLD
jgi:cytoskeleton protein RodZ